METIKNWILGDMSGGERIWSALLPALLLGSYFLLGALVYFIRFLARGRYRDAEIEARGSSWMIGPGARAYFAWVMRPLWRIFQILEIPPNAVTTLSMLLASASAVAVAFGRFSLAGWLYLFAGACDFIDGRLARTTGKASKAGAALDSILDRYAESVVLIGLGWFYRDSWVLMVVLAALVGSMMVSYVRARGEGLGVDVKVGLMQRPERLALLGVAMAFAPVVEAIYVPNDPRPIHRLAVGALVILAAGANLTAFRRFFHVYKALDEKPNGPSYLSVGKGSLARTIVAAVIATACDFGVVYFLVSGLRMNAAAATALGCVAGGIINFGINRVWTFGSQNAPLKEAWRYTIVSASSALLNSGGVAVLLLVPNLDYRIAWVIVRAAVFIGWNYPLQRDFVFAPPADDDSAVEEPSYVATA